MNVYLSPLYRLPFSGLRLNLQEDEEEAEEKWCGLEAKPLNTRTKAGDRRVKRRGEHVKAGLESWAREKRDRKRKREENGLKLTILHCITVDEGESKRVLLSKGERKDPPSLGAPHPDSIWTTSSATRSDDNG